MLAPPEWDAQDMAHTVCKHLTYKILYKKLVRQSIGSMSKAHPLSLPHSTLFTTIKHTKMKQLQPSMGIVLQYGKLKTIIAARCDELLHF